MGLFSKSEAELKEIAAGLEKKQSELNNRESDLKSALQQLDYNRSLFESSKSQFETERFNHLEEVKRIGDSISAEKADIEKRRSDIALKESEAKAAFAAAQREAFEEVVEKRQAELDMRQKKLDDTAADLLKRLEDFHAKEGETAKRELELTEREQEANAGFADKTRALAEEASRQHQANQAEALRLKDLADTLAGDRQSVENEKDALLKRERELVAAEQTRDAGYTEERLKLDIETREKRTLMEAEITAAREARLSALEDEIAKLKSKRLENIADAEQIERERIRAEIAKEREDWVNEQESARKQLERDRLEIDRQRGAVSAIQSETERNKAELEAAERTLERKEEMLERRWQKKHDELDDSLAEKLQDERESMKEKNKTMKDRIDSLNDSLRTQDELFGAFEQLKRQLGDKDPAEYIRDLNSKTDEMKRLREELNTRPTEEMRTGFKEMETKVKEQKALAEQYKEQLEANNADAAEAVMLRHENSKLVAENRSLAQEAGIYKSLNNKCEAELKRLTAAYEKSSDNQKRYTQIEEPFIKADKAKNPDEKDIDEMTWLTNIKEKCDGVGIHFHPRILNAFHTALKISDWSILTILAGVSGTGKSELPRHYAHFGGIYFDEISVQPNWDSQESMLGFFNSIDDEFDAKSVLHFLAQSQKKWEEKTDTNMGYPGLNKAVCLVLLDEMNLAHPELYFAEFLSKLERRRGLKGLDVPYLSVSIGAGRPPYQLPLGRNVLWAGTMNQDETTKSLSDKVLDRSIIIHFPRPTELKRRDINALTDGKDGNRGAILHRKSWEKWLTRESPFSPEQVKPYKEFVEGINSSLEVAGRAFGHRVWQSIEHYMANYPGVRDAMNNADKNKHKLDDIMHTAFEDQLVQKIMPKLRGIDTRGKSKTECLDKIALQLNAVGVNRKPFNLKKDFNLACELGYGQFIWQSANYLNAEIKPEEVSSAEGQTASNGLEK